MAVNLPRPLYIVDAGSCPGVYFSKEGYKEYCKQKGIGITKPETLQVIKTQADGKDPHED